MTERISVATLMQRQAADMPERGRRGLQEAVRRLCNRLGLKDSYYHTGDSRKSAPGFPDVLLIVPERVNGVCSQQVVMELKRQGERPTKDQERWLDLFTDAVPGGKICGVYLIWPSDLLSGDVERVILGRYDQCISLEPWAARRTHWGQPGR